MGRALAVLAVLLSFVVVVSQASAQAPYEPNDSIGQAAGPLVGGANLSATLETDNDYDWYRLHLLGGQQVQFTRTPGCPGTDENGPAVALYDNLGLEVIGFISTFSWTTPYAGGTYYLAVFPFKQCRSYSLRVDPSSAVVTSESPAPAPGTWPETNEDDVHATGPLSGNVLYSGGQETSNDRDNGFFFMMPNRRLTIEVTNATPASYTQWAPKPGDPFRVEQACTLDNTLTLPTGAKLAGTAPSDALGTTLQANTRRVYTIDSGPGGRALLALSGAQERCRWQVLISPVGAVSANSSAGKISARCKAARRAHSQALRRYRREKLRSRPSAKRLRVLRRTVKNARNKVTRVCGT